MVFSYAFSPQSQIQRLIWAGSLISLSHDAQEQWISCSRAGDLSNISILIYNPQHCWCSPGCSEALILWCPLWTASSGHPSSAQSPCGWSRVLFSRKLPRNDTTLKVQTHRFIIQSFRRTLIQNHFCLGAFTDARSKEKPARRGVVMSPAVPSPSSWKGEGFKDTHELPGLGRETYLCHATAEAPNSHISSFKKS